MNSLADISAIYLDLERDAMLYRAGFMQSLRALHAMCAQADLTHEHSDGENTPLLTELDAAARIAELFTLIFYNSDGDQQQKLAACQTVQAQLDSTSLARVLLLLIQAKLTTLSDPLVAEGLFKDALQRAMQLDIPEWGLIANLRLARYYIYISHYEMALALCYEALDIMHRMPDRNAFIAPVEFHLALCFLNLHEVEKAIQHFEVALENYRTQDLPYFVAYTLQSLASAYYQLNDEQRAQQCYEECARSFTDLGELEAAGHAHTNLGLSYLRTQRFAEAGTNIERARELFEHSADFAARAGNCLHQAMLLGNPDYEYYDRERARSLYQAAFDLADKTVNRHLVANIYLSRSNFFRAMNDWPAAFDDYEKYAKLEREVFHITVDEKIRSLEQSFERKMAEQEQRLTTSLLQKMLPDRIVERMKHDEHVADYFESVAVYFADIANFTAIAEHLSPLEVIVMLNNVFSIFDAAMSAYQCEKIKTIGDGYMAIAGAPNALSHHRERMLLAALQLQEEMRHFTVGQALHNHQHPAADTVLAFRMGLHCGSLVAGVVGAQRFMYDVYGDTVNTAARMESHGKVNEIQLSSAFVQELCELHGVPFDDHEHQLVVELHLLEPEPALVRFIPRGMIPVKGKGSMHTYFVERVPA